MMKSPLMLCFLVFNRIPCVVLYLVGSFASFLPFPWVIKTPKSITSRVPGADNRQYILQQKNIMLVQICHYVDVEVFCWVYYSIFKN